MTDTACGFNRQPIGEDWTPEQINCEQKAWDRFEAGCLVCSGGLLCISQKYTDYINERAQCLEGTECCGG